MSLFIAERGPDRHPETTPRLSVIIAHIEDSKADNQKTILWLWVPELHNPGKPATSSNLLWSDWPDPQKPLRFGELDVDSRYRGIARLEVKRKAFHSLIDVNSIESFEPLSLSTKHDTLRAFIDDQPADITSLVHPRLVKTIAQFASHQSADFSLISLENWLSSQIPKNVTFNHVASQSGFTTVMENRSHLFSQLAEIVRQQRMIFLVGSAYSSLNRFISGFQQYVQTHPSGTLADVSVQFDMSVFQLLLTQRQHSAGRTYLMELELLFATLAYCSLRCLRESTRRPSFKGFDYNTLDDAAVFAEAFRTSIAAHKHKKHLDYVLSFLGFLDKAVRAVGFKGRLTIFLPFETIERLIIDNAIARRQLWAAMTALSLHLEKYSEKCPQLGIILSTPSLPIDNSTTASFVRLSVVYMPPFSKAELHHLLSGVFGGNVEQSDVEVLNIQTGGAPWFVYLVLRCLECVESHKMQEACDLAIEVLRSADGRKGASLPLDLVRDTKAYFEDVRDILSRELNGGLGISGTILRAWEDPDRSWASKFGRMEFASDQVQVLLQTGLFWVQPVGIEQGASLSCLLQYPRFTFSRAGALQTEFLERVRSLSGLQAE